MKKTIFFKTILVFLILAGTCQLSLAGVGHPCSTPEQTMEERSQRRAERILLKRKTAAQASYQLPIIFHVIEPVWDTQVDGAPQVGSNEEEGKEIMYCRVKDAIRLMNEEFSGTREGYSNTLDPTFEPIRKNFDIEFVPAAIDPDGNAVPEPGMNWQPEIEMGDFRKSDREWGIIEDDVQWTGKSSRSYVEVYLVAGKGGALGSGYTNYPWSSKPAAVIFNYRWLSHECGSEGKPTSRNADFASILTHEFGHYFGLNHTFSGGCGNSDCENDGDDICDTPPTSSDYDIEGGSPSQCHNVNDCGHEVNAENFMDYACYKMFTEDQVDEMEYYLLGNGNQTYQRDNLWKPENIDATTALEPPQVSITSPEDGAQFDAQQEITLAADASDTDGDISSVEFFVNGSSVGTDDTEPYEITWEIPEEGAFEITAEAIDNNYQSTISDQVSISGVSIAGTNKTPGAARTFSADISPITGTGIYKLAINGHNKDNYELQVLNAGGQVIHSRDLHPGTHVLDISGQPQGVYIVHFPGTRFAPLLVYRLHDK